MEQKDLTKAFEVLVEYSWKFLKQLELFPNPKLGFGCSQ